MCEKENKAPGHKVSDIRPLPRNPEAEKAVLGSMIAKPSCIPDVSVVLSAPDFGSEKAGELFELILSMFSNSEVIDMLTVTSKANSCGLLSRMGGMVGFSALLAEYATPSNVEYYCELIKDCSRRRRLILSAQGAENSAHRMDVTPEETVDALVNSVLSINCEKVDSSPASMASEAFERITARTKKRMIATGWKDFDMQMDGGIERRVLTNLIGRKEKGKSLFAQNLAVKLALNRERVAYIMLEDDPTKVVFRQICMLNNWTLHKLESTDKSIMDTDQLTSAFSRWTDLGINVWGKQHVGTSFQSLFVYLMRQKKRAGLDVVILDSAHMVRPTRTKEQNGEEAEFALVDKLAALAQSLDIAVLPILHQRKKPPPSFGQDKNDSQEDDLEAKGSGAWGYLARVEFHFSRGITPDQENTMILRVTKNSDGPKPLFHFSVNPKTYRIMVQ